MRDRPQFLDLPLRSRKPRLAGITHVLDKAAPPSVVAAALDQSGDAVDVLKLGWGLACVDPHFDERVRVCTAAGVLLCLGGTLMEQAVAQGRFDALRGWALDHGVPAVEVSNGLCAMTAADKTALVRRLSADFVVLAETGAKDAARPVVVRDWVTELAADLDAGARWVVTEGRESGTVGLYHADGTPREELVSAIVDGLPVNRVVFEAPAKSQQAWLIRALGPNVNLGNVALEEVLPVETLRLGLRADTARLTPLVRLPGAVGAVGAGAVR